MLKNITIKQLKELMKQNNINLIDIRSESEYEKGHIINSKNIPYLDILKEPFKYLNNNETYYFYCETGKTSLNLCVQLVKKGYDAINILGGYNSWIISN